MQLTVNQAIDKLSQISENGDERVKKAIEDLKTIKLTFSYSGRWMVNISSTYKIRILGVAN